MIRFLITLFFILSFINVNASENPVKISLECDDKTSDVKCDLKLNISDGWKVYAHNPENEMFLNITFNDEKSSGVDHIKVDWGSQRVEYDTTQNTSFYIDNTPIKISFVTLEDSYRAVLDVSYVACNNFCGTFKEEVVHTGVIQSNLFYIILLAFAGGFILNLMPCVLPVIFMKFMHISKKSQRKNSLIKKEIVMIFLGILFSFIVLGIITIIMKSFGNTFGWGIHFQQPIFVGFLSVVTGVSTMNLLGIGTFRTPDFVQKLLDKFDNKNFISDFLHGVFVVLLATPCTAPFLTTAVAFCLSQDSKTILLVYTSIAFGLGLPYILIAFTPNALKILPKPGIWMERFKLVAAVPFGLTAIWLFYVFVHQVNTYYSFVIPLLILLPFIMKNLKIGIVLILVLLFVSFSLKEESKKFDGLEQIHKEISNEKTVIVNVTAKWCITCKINDKLIFSNKDIIKKLEEQEVFLATIDYTNKSNEIDEFIRNNKRSGIPLTIVYGPNAKDGIILPVIFSKDDLFKALEKVK